MKITDVLRTIARIAVPLLLMVLVWDFDVRLREERESAGRNSGGGKELLRTAGQVRDDLTLAMGLLEECFGHPVDLHTVRSVPVTLTAYSSTVDQCDSMPHITASLHPVRIGIVAISDDLMEEMGLTFGQRVLIPGHGLFQVQDRMNSRWHRRVDIWHEDRKAARLFGQQEGTLLWAAPEFETVLSAADGGKPGS